MVVIDTSVWIDYFHNVLNEKTILMERILLSDKQIIIPAVIYVEILQGIKSDKDFKVIKSILDEFVFFPLSDKTIFLKSIEIFRKCRNSGYTIRKTIDCLIASIVLINNFEFLHNDRDFVTIGNLFPLNFV
ncbi:MAG: PIN domain-containing protein [Candidatus Cloacimonetes bacterium]|nr:PIN domain-containing protein [Candidatus Cloacimonadota bacterium]